VPEDNEDVQQTNPQVPITLVLRNGQQIQVQNYAVMDQTFWDFTRQPARKIPVSSIDIAASTRATEAKGAESRGGALHEAIGRRSMAARILSYRYLGRYLVRRFFEGAWREPFFPMSAPGRIFLKDGYSAGVMRLIYDQPARAPLLDRVFYGYPLHRAVRDRLGILERRIEQELRKRLSDRGKLTIFTAPSGFAYDVLHPLKKLVDSDASVASRVVLVAADLDPSGQLAPELTARAKGIGVRFEFLRGDLTGPELRSQGERFGPFELALFVGLYMYRIRKGRVVEASLIGAAATLAVTVIGTWIPGSVLEPYFQFSRGGTIWAICIYGFIASVLPVWLLLCPRDYLSSFLKIGTVALIVVGIFVANPVLPCPTVNHTFEHGGPTFKGDLFPFLFICLCLFYTSPSPRDS